MKQTTITLLIGIFFLTACAGTAPLAPTATVSISNSVTSTPSPTTTATQTPLPSSTPTSSITPLPTIPTFTPTFDAQTIVTVTPAPKAECPKENPSLTPDLNTLFSVNPIQLMDQPALDFLNNGGSPQKIISAFREHYHWLRSNIAIQQDITGDGIAELILTDGYIVYVFGCKDNKYQTLLSDTDDLGWMQEIHFHVVKDMNLNGIPELIDIEYGGHTYTSIKVSIFEWNGQEFLPLIQGKSYGNKQYFTFADTSVPAHVNIHDIDGDGILDLVLESDLPIPVPSLYD